MTIIKRLSGSNEEISRILYEEQLQLSQQNLDVEEAVSEIIERVKQDGDQALRDYTMLFDKVEVTDFEIGQELIDQAFEEIDPEVLGRPEKCPSQYRILPPPAVGDWF